MSARSSSTPASSKVPPKEHDALRQILETLLGFGNEHFRLLLFVRATATSAEDSSARGGKPAGGGSSGARMRTT